MNSSHPRDNTQKCFFKHFTLLLLPLVVTSLIYTLPALKNRGNQYDLVASILYNSHTVHLNMIDMLEQPYVSTPSLVSLVHNFSCNRSLHASLNCVRSTFQIPIHTTTPPNTHAYLDCSCDQSIPNYQ